MGKKNASAAAKAAKKAKAQVKTERKEKKKVTKTKSKSKGTAKDESDSDDDLEGILEKMRKEWEDAHKVTEELVEGPPSRRANATLTPCPNGAHLWCVGGEFFSDDGRAFFYNDTFRYSPEKDEWRKFVSPTCPGPRSAHAVATSAAGGGKLFLFGGEFSSLHQTTFHHYRDFWCFDIQTHMWDRIETKIKPSARSGHRMAMWKHFIVLFGGFYDPGITTRYLNDLWVFDTQEYCWKQVEFKETELKPSPRSGFSFLPTPDGIVLHGGYCKEYKKGQRPVGVMLEDTWFLKLSLPDATQPPPTPTSSSSKKAAAPPPPSSSRKFGGAGRAKPPSLIAKWERRKRPSDAFAPTLRSGCTMALWVAKNTAVMFGGVTDEDRHEETLESVFWNDIYGYQLSGKGKWVSLALKQPKKGGGGKAKKKQQQQKKGGQDDSDDEWRSGGKSNTKDPQPEVTATASSDAVPEDPTLTIPSPRYNTMLAVLRNTLYLYGGIFERGSKEYTLDDFYSVQLDKMDRFVCLKESEVVVPPEGGEDEESSSDDDDEEGDESGDDDSDDEDIWYGDEGEDEDEGEGEGEERRTIDEDVENQREVEVERKDDANEDEPDVKGNEKQKPKKKKSKKKKDEDVETVASEADLSQATKDEDELEDDSTDLRKQASAFMSSSKTDPTTSGRTEEDVLSTPLPGETLAMFYARSRDYWTQKAASNNENRGKELRRVGFGLAEERYESYKPLLAEVEKILAEAGLDEEEMRRGAQGTGSSGQGQSRNRR